MEELKSLVDCFHRPILILSTAGKIIFMNDSATLLLEKVGLVNIPATIREVSEEIAQAVSSLSQSDPGKRIQLSAVVNQITVNAWCSNCHSGRVMLELGEHDDKQSFDEIQLNAVVESAVDAVIGIETSGQIHTANAAALAMFGYVRVEQLLGQDVRVLTAEPHRSRHPQYIRRYVQTGEARVLMGHALGSSRLVKAQRSDGTTFNARLTLSEAKLGSRRSFFAFIRDVSKEELHQRDLQLGQLKYEAIASCVKGDAVIVIDVHGVNQWVNEECSQLLGYSREELIGQSVTLLMEDKYAQRHQQYIQRYLRTGEARVLGKAREFTARRKDGRTFPIVLSVAEVHSGPSHYFVGVIRDSTAKHQQEAKVKRAEGILDSFYDRVRRYGFDPPNDPPTNSNDPP